jgi:hypothetical protein
MTTNDFSSQFDVLLNSYAIPARFGSTDSSGTIELDEYEKSVLLTQSQEEEVISLYNGRNASGESFEQTEELRRYLAPLVKEAELAPIATSNGNPLGMESSSKFFTLPDDLWFITYERALSAGEACDYKAKQEVYPVRQDEYHKIRKNPFRGASDRRALRLDLSDNVIEIISKFGVTSYYVRYLKKLKPIVLVDLTGDNLAVNGVSVPTECELHESLHPRILERAVMLALRSRGYTGNNNENR